MNIIDDDILYFYIDVVIPTNSSSKSKIIIKAGQRVMVLKSAKGIYMQLDSGKIIAIRTMNKPNPINLKNDKPDIIDITGESETAAETKPEKSEIENTNSSFTGKVYNKLFSLILFLFELIL